MYEKNAKSELVFKVKPQKQEQKQFEQSESFRRMKDAMRKIFAVPKEELERREAGYQRKRKRRSHTNGNRK